MAPTVDAVTLTVIEKGLQQVCSEMDLVHEKTSFSPVISEGLDRANGLYHRDTGEVIAQGETGLPSFIGVMQFSTQHIIREWVNSRGASRISQMPASASLQCSAMKSTTALIESQASRGTAVPYLFER